MIAQDIAILIYLEKKTRLLKCLNITKMKLEINLTRK